METMTVKQAFKKLQASETLSRSLYNSMFDINFINDKKTVDEVEFTVSGTHSLKEICKELSELFSNFCKENKLPTKSVTSITYVGRDPYYG